MTRIDQNVDTEFEVAPTMHMDNSRDPVEARPGIDEKKPVIEKHITNIPQHDPAASLSSSSNDYDSTAKDQSHGAHKENLKDKIKKHLPGHHGSDGTVEPERHDVDLKKQDSGTSDFEVAGFMPMTSHDSSESASGASNRKPRLERHISSIPDDDLSGEEENGGMSSKLRRKISHIAQND